MMKCDICSEEAIGSIVSSEEMRTAVIQNGFNPFERNALGQSEYSRWKQMVLEDTSDWNICDSCMQYIKPYLERTQDRRDNSKDDDNTKNDMILEVVCPLCRTKYRIGEDSVVTTPQAVLGDFGENVIGPEGAINEFFKQPDIIEKIDIKDSVYKADLLKKSRKRIVEIKKSLADGRQRFWKCFKCDNTDTPTSYGDFLPVKETKSKAKSFMIIGMMIVIIAGLVALWMNSRDDEKHNSGIKIEKGLNGSKKTATDPVALKETYGANEVDAKLSPVFTVAPLYPEEARKKGIQGAVKVKFLVNKQGDVEKMQIIESKPVDLFDQSVLNCVSKWRFKPGTVKGIPVNTWQEITIRFELE